MLRSTYDTSDYVSRIQEEEPDTQGRTSLSKLTRWNVREWAEFDFRKAELDTVAGATLTSYALAKGLQTRFADDQHGGRGPVPQHRFSFRRPLSQLRLYICPQITLWHYVWC